jgi:hypothetical protein
MNQNPVQRGRWVVTVGAIVIIVSCFLQWWRLGGGPGELAATTGIGIADQGLIMFVAAVLTLLLITLPYASQAPLAIDRPISFLLLFGAAIVAFIWRVYDMLQSGLLLYTGQTPPIQPLRGPGFWLALVGLVVFARGVFELWEARRR